jgi:dTDP-4-dehydrorhamnose reductase
VAVTGSTGRLGRALVAALVARGIATVAWSRPDYDLDDPAAAERLVARDRPARVIHAAAWTDVDGCARDPALAARRNGEAVAELAAACVRAGAALTLISTNEVFDGARADGRGYDEDDEPRPANPYGASKLAGERAALAAFAGESPAGANAAPAAADAPADAGPGLTIVRTAWLYGPPGNDFPTKVLAAAARLPAGAPLKMVADEVGSPTHAVDLAQAIVGLVTRVRAGTYHLVNAGTASRLEAAQVVLARCRTDIAVQPIRAAEFVRASTPPAWAVLDAGKAARLGVVLRPWDGALREYAASLCSEPETPAAAYRP